MSAEKHIANINETVTGTLVAVKACKSRSGSVKILRDACESLSQEVAYFKEHHKRAFVGTRKTTQVVRNALSSVADGIESGDLSRAELRNSLSFVEKHFENFSAAAAADQEVDLNVPVVRELSEKQKAVEVSSSTVKRAAKVAETGDVAATPLPVETTKALKQFAGARAELPTRIDSSYELLRLPVVPLFPEAKHLNRIVNLEKLGLRGVSLEGYTIIDSQTVLLFSRRTAKKHDLSPLEFAEAALSSINERLTQKLALATDTYIASPKNADHLLFWLMPAIRVAALFKAAGAKSGTIKWGLPF